MPGLERVTGATNQSNATFQGDGMTRSSRDKLNSFHLMGAIGLAGIIAAVSGSWLLFLLVGAALVGASVLTGEVRPPRR